VTRDIAASVRQRLLNLAREQGRPFQEVLQFFVTRLGEGIRAEPDFGTVLGVLEKFLGEPVNYLTGSDTGTALWNGERWRTLANGGEAR